MSRIGAGVVDVCLAVAGGVGASAVSYALGGDAATSALAAQGAALGIWVLRDALSPDGNRSIGKRLFKLELAHWDGALPSFARSAARNAYFLALPLSQAHPLLEMVWTLVLVFDISSVLFTQDARKLGDYMLGTRVVDERPGRAARVQDREELEEIQFLQAEIRDLAPQPQTAKAASALTSESAGSAPQPKWFERVRKEVGATAGLPVAHVAAPVVSTRGPATALHAAAAGAAAAAAAPGATSVAPAADAVSAVKDGSGASTIGTSTTFLVHPPKPGSKR
jgi:hypothetical protein